MTRRQAPYLDLIARNLYVANRDANVAETLAEDVELYQPDVFAYSEASTHADVLAKVAPLLGYTVLQETPARRRRKAGAVDDTGDCALLIGAHVAIRHSWVSRMRRAWLVMRYRRRHQPHRYQVSAIKVRGHRVRVRASHWPTGGRDGGNAAAWLESARKSRRWLRRGLVPSVDVGDLNESQAVLADWYGKRFRVFGKGIDVAVTRGYRWCSWTELGKGGGDHHGRHYRFTA